MRYSMPVVHGGCCTTVTASLMRRKAEEELANGAEDGAYCNLLLRLCERVRVWNNAPQDRREDALAAFDAEDDEDDGAE